MLHRHPFEPYGPAMESGSLFGDASSTHLQNTKKSVSDVPPERRPTKPLPKKNLHTPTPYVAGATPCRKIVWGQRSTQAVRDPRAGLLRGVPDKLEQGGEEWGGRRQVCLVELR